MIRRLAESDWEALRALRLEALETEPQSFVADPTEYRTKPSEYWAGRARGSADSLILGTFVNDRLVGMVGLVRQPQAKTRHKAMIWGMYVSPAFRRARLGHLLLEAVLQEARRMEGLEQITLSVVTTNTTAAVALYRNVGFQYFGTEPRALRVGDVYLDEEWMALTLDRTTGGKPA